MKILFARSYLPGSYAIRALTFSSWSHVALVDDRGVAIEATWPRVRETAVEKIIASHSEHAFGEIAVPDPAAVFLFGLEQEGKGYDLGGLFALLIARRDWQADDKWFCSELAAAALNAGGAKLFRDCWRVTPQMLWEISQ